VLSPGDVAAFAPGPAGAHEERNDGDAPARFLLVSTRPELDVTESPMENVVNVYSPHGTERFRKGERVDLWGGER
jgi:uncharacterized cupin superfamily protein